MEKITSRQNSRVKELVKLQSKKHRRQKQQFLLEGFTLIEAALQAGAALREIYISADIEEKEELEKIKNLAGDGAIFINLSPPLMEEVSTTVNPQGIVAVAEKKTASLEDLLVKPEPLLLLARIQDPGNAGTLLRTAAGAGIEGVIALKGTVDLYNPKVIRSSMGGMFRASICTDVELEDFIKAVIDEAEERRLVMAQPDSGQLYFEADFSRNDIFVVGNESRGLPGELKSLNHIPVSIPLPGGLESLNAAVAGSIIIFDWLRQNH